MVSWFGVKPVKDQSGSRKDEFSCDAATWVTAATGLTSAALPEVFVAGFLGT